VRRNQQERLAELAAVSPHTWPCNTLGNHDSSRASTRYGDGVHDALQARLWLTLPLTLRGTPFLYNGEEIGMSDLILDNIAQFRDLMGTWQYHAWTQELNMTPDEALAKASRMTRDKNRTPMQWENAPNAGFSPAGVETWLPVNSNFAQGVNVADQMTDPASLLQFYRRLIWLRRQIPALIAGDYQPIFPRSRRALVFLRQSSQPAQTCLVAMNFSDQVYRLKWRQALAGKVLQVLFASQEDLPTASIVHQPTVSLAPFGILIAQADPIK
jgi:alpha-glucosidase